MFITTAVYTYEGQDVATYNIPGTYIYTYTYKYVMMLLGVAMADIMMKVAPKIYQKYIIISIKGKPIIYVQIKKVLYILI